MNRYRVTVTVDKLEDPESWVNPDTGKVEEHRRVKTIKKGKKKGKTEWDSVVPPWEKIFQFGVPVGVDAESFTEALPVLDQQIASAYQKAREVAPLADMG